MSKQTSMTSLITKVNGIVMYSERKDVELVKGYIQKFEDEYLSVLASQYGCIIHDRDVNEDGIMKKIHVHLVFLLKKRKRKSTIINDLASYFHVTGLAVSVEAYQTFEGSFQYLIHKNDPQKFQYDAGDIITDLDDDEINMVLEEKTSVIDFKSLKAFCLTAESIMDVIEYVGIPAYARYWKPINDIYDTCVHIRETRPIIPKETDF